ncbi:MFS transporter [Craterilacuibacter sp. RT1T]|uniref:MFS transporter n=1 Tax=Craterilacuibacter sp. RT1T TaxID=2942211 RepID=UPI0020BF174E|nr:MFS transporter [Craterilacuibacter sp. RT1T]MCL6263188.1 MFS transporter [Craterilacuibacter sp. RT1T]
MDSANPHQRLLDLLDMAPLSAIHCRLWLLASGGTLLNGVSLMLLGIAIPLLVPAFTLSLSMQGLLGAALVFGSVPGALLGGRAADRYGRKPLFLADMLLIALGALLAATAKSFAQLLYAQLLIGFGIGIDFPVSGAYVAELMPMAKRARLMVALKGMQALGMLLGIAMGLLLLEAWPATGAWRALLGTLGVLALLLFALRLLLVESPRWLMLRGQNLAAAHIIASLVPSAVFASLRHGVAAGHVPHVLSLAAPEHAYSMRSLFQHAYLRRTLLVCLPWCLMDVATYGVGLFTPVILAALSLNEAGASLIGRDVAASRGSALVDMALLLGAAASLYFVPWLGAIRAQFAGFIGMAAGMTLMLLPLLGIVSEHALLWTLAGFSLYNLAMSAGPNATTFALPPELFPTQLRGSACGLAASVAKLGACAGVLLLPSLRADGGIASVLGLMFAVSLAGAALTVCLGGHGIPLRPLEAHQQAEGEPS